MMGNENISLTTQAKTYVTPLDKPSNGSASSQPSKIASHVSNGSLQIKKPIFDTALHPPKGTIWKSTFNPSS